MRHLLVVGILLLSGCSDGTPEISQHSSGDFAPNQVAGRDAIQNVQVQLSAAAEERLVQSLIDKGVPVAERAAELEELKRKYADLEQRLGEYAKTDELAQQARQALEQGNLDQAEALLQQAYDKDMEEAWRGMQQAAQTQQQERELAAAILGEADMLKANGDGKAAQEKYAAAHAAFVKAAKADPQQTEWQRDLSVSYDRIGDLYRANGDNAAALKAYQDGLTIRDKLVKLNPNIVEWQTDLIDSYYRMADVQPDKAQDFMLKALEILQKLDNSDRLPKDWEQWLETTKKRLE